MTTTAAYYSTDSSFSGAGWTNPNNINADDGSLATAICSRTPNYPLSGYTSTPTDLLQGGTFPGIFAGMANGDTIDGIMVEVRAKQSGTARVRMTVGLSSFVSTKTLELTSTLTTYTLGGAADVWGGNLYGAALYNACATFVDSFYASSEMLESSGDTTVSVDYIRVTITWHASNPAAYTFTDQPTATANTEYISNAITVSGLPGGVSVPGYLATEDVASNYSFLTHATLGTFYYKPKTFTSIYPNTLWEKNFSGIWMDANTSFTAVNGDQFRVKCTSPQATEGGTYSFAGIILGGRSDWLDVFLPSDTAPDAFSFARMDSAARSTVVQADSPITVAGINAAAAISISGAGGEYKIDGGAWTSSAGTVTLGQTVYVRCTSSASYATAVTTTLTIGGVAGGFTVQTVAQDVQPAPWVWTQVDGATPSTLYTSNTVVLGGFDGAIAFSFSLSGGTVGEWQKNGGAWTAIASPTTVTAGDSFAVRFISAAGANAFANMWMNIGSGFGFFNVANGTCDTQPSAYTFTSVTDAIPGVTYTSNTQVLAGMTAATPTLANPTNGSLKVNAGAFSTNIQNVSNGDTISCQLVASLVPGATKQVSIRIGSVVNTYSVTTRNFPIGW